MPVNRIKALFKSLSGGGVEKPAFPGRELAAAALMVEAAAMDGTIGPREQDAILALLTEKFHLSEDEAAELLAEAQKAQGEATHLMRFTRVLKESMSEKERIGLIEMMWRVAVADGVIHDYEDNLIRRVAGLLYVTDHDRGDAKKRALEALKRD